MSERKIGEIFFDGNVALQVEKSSFGFGCWGCYYSMPNGCARNRDAAGACSDLLRTDHQFVIYKEIQL